MKIRLTVSKRLLHEFRSAAIKAFPKETCSFLIGTDTGEKLGPIRYMEITELFWPKDLHVHGKNDRVNFQDAWFLEANEHSKEAGLQVVGEVHTHPYTHDEISLRGMFPDCSESEADQDVFKWNKLSGICVMTQSASGRIRTRIRFWGPRVPVEMV